jgi:hypothetical protein
MPIGLRALGQFSALHVRNYHQHLTQAKTLAAKQNKRPN